jgi:hypothetical protein
MRCTLKARSPIPSPITPAGFLYCFIIRQNSIDYTFNAFELSLNLIRFWLEQPEPALEPRVKSVELVRVMIANRPGVWGFLPR